MIRGFFRLVGLLLLAGGAAMAGAVPTVGPSREYIPPSTTAKTMRRETPIPASVSGLT